MLQAVGMEPHSSQGCRRGDPQPLDPLESLLPALSRDLLPVPVPRDTFGASTPLSPLRKGHSRPGTPVLSLAHRWGQPGPVTVATRHPPERGGGGLAAKAHKSQIVLPCHREGLAVVA